MTLEPLLTASPIIQIHAYAAMAALLTGGAILFLPKGNARHRTLGRAWVGLMVVVAASSFGIWEIRMFGLFSPIHLFSAVVLYALYKGVEHIRARRVGQHRRTMQTLYVASLVVSGVFTLAPGRIMHKVVFGPGYEASVETLTLVGAVILGVSAAWIIFRTRRQPD